MVQPNAGFGSTMGGKEWPSGPSAERKDCGVPVTRRTRSFGRALRSDMMNVTISSGLKSSGNRTRAVVAGAILFAPFNVLVPFDATPAWLK